MQGGFRSAENILELHHGADCTILNILKPTKLYAKWLNVMVCELCLHEKCVQNPFYTVALHSCFGRTFYEVYQRNIILKDS